MLHLSPLLWFHEILMRKCKYSFSCFLKNSVFLYCAHVFMELTQEPKSLKTQTEHIMICVFVIGIFL